MPKMNNVHLKGTLLGKSIAISCCCSPALCGALTASTSCALDATLPSKPLMTVKTKHEIQFAKAVADRVIFMDGGQIVEENEPKEFFEHPKTERAKQFLNVFSFE